MTDGPRRDQLHPQSARARREVAVVCPRAKTIALGAIETPRFLELVSRLIERLDATVAASDERADRLATRWRVSGQSASTASVFQLCCRRNATSSRLSTSGSRPSATARCTRAMLVAKSPCASAAKQVARASRGRSAPHAPRTSSCKPSATCRPRRSSRWRSAERSSSASWQLATGAPSGMWQRARARTPAFERARFRQCTATGSGRARSRRVANRGGHPRCHAAGGVTAHPTRTRAAGSGDRCSTPVAAALHHGVANDATDHRAAQRSARPVRAPRPRGVLAAVRSWPCDRCCSSPSSPWVSAAAPARCRPQARRPAATDTPIWVPQRTRDRRTASRRPAVSRRPTVLRLPTFLRGQMVLLIPAAPRPLTRGQGPLPHRTPASRSR